MSKECADTVSNTKPQRSIFQRFIHSSLFRSCWAINQQTINEPTASTSLLAQDGSSTNYQSRNIQTTTSNNQAAANDTVTKDAPKYQKVQPNTIQPLENAELQQLNSIPPGQIDEIATYSYSTTSSSEMEMGDEQQNLTTIESAASKIGPGSSLIDYLIADAQHQTQDDYEKDELKKDEAAERFRTEWERYTNLPNMPQTRRKTNEPYDDLIAHSLDDYDEKAEIEWEMRNRSEPVEYGPITRQEHIRLTFCRIKRHNACSKLKNDDPKTYYFKSQVGEGSFSTVYEAIRMEDRKQYAIKVANKRQIARERKIQYVTREKDIMSLLTYSHKNRHPFICGIFCTFQEVDKLYYVLDYAAHGELLMWLHRLGSFDLQVSTFYASEIVAALDYIHECGIIHRDLKPENILIRNDWHIMISDFGSSKVIGYEGDERLKSQMKPMKQRSTFVGTAQYISPEVASGKPCGPEADFWALGNIVFQMISGQPPFRGVNEYQILQKVNKLLYRFPDGFDEIAKDLVKKLLIADVESRLGHNGIDEIKEHPFFKDIEWENIIDQKPPELKPYLPASSGEPEFYSELNFSQIETGLSNNTIARLMGITSKPAKPSPTSERPRMSETTRHDKLEAQRRDHPYHSFVGDVLILKSGLIDKKKGLFARRRMFLLTENGRLLYVDPNRNILKGEIPLSKEMRTEAKNFRTFFVHTPTRIYFLFDPERRALEWCSAIENVRNSVFGKPTEEDLAKVTGNQRGKNSSRQFKSSVSN